jgi:RNA polymerase sigma-70 factor (ECF subfamily)
MPLRFTPDRPSRNSIRDPEGFQQLYEHHHLDVFRFIFGLHGGPIQEVEDLTTQTFLRAWKSRRSFQGDQAAAFAWVLKIARNLTIDSHRQQARNPAPLDIETQVIPTYGVTPEELVARHEQYRILWDLLGRLPDQQREIVTLRYLLAWRVKDIAAHLALTENHVSVLLRRVIQRLKKEWPSP